MKSDFLRLSFEKFNIDSLADACYVIIPRVRILRSIMFRVL